MRCYDGKCIFIIYVIELFTKFDQNCVPSPWCPSSAGLSVSGWGPFLRDPIQHRRNLHSLRLAPPRKTGLLSVYVYSCTVDCTCGPTRPLMTSGAWPRDLSSSRLLPCDKTGFVPVRVYTACTLLSRRDCREPACESPMLSQEKLVSRTETKPGSTQSWESWKTGKLIKHFMSGCRVSDRVLINWKLCPHLTLRCVAASQAALSAQEPSLPV